MVAILLTRQWTSNDEELNKINNQAPKHCQNVIKGLANAVFYRFRHTQYRFVRSVTSIQCHWFVKSSSLSSLLIIGWMINNYFI